MGSCFGLVLIMNAAVGGTAGPMFLLSAGGDDDLRLLEVDAC